jgi:hypothetical protein
MYCSTAQGFTDAFGVSKCCYFAAGEGEGIQKVLIGSAVSEQL